MQGHFLLSLGKNIGATRALHLGAITVNKFLGGFAALGHSFLE